VVAPPATGKTTPPIPHISVATEQPDAEAPAVVGKAPIWKKKTFQLGALAALVVLGGGYFAFRKFTATPPPPPVVVKPKLATAAPAKPPAASPAPVAPEPALADKPAQPGPALSETQSAIAHAPVNAVNKANSVIAKREASGQSRDAVGAIVDGEEPADKSPVKPAAAAKPAPNTTPASTTIAPGISATTSDVTAASEASPAFRSFVANAKIAGVFQGDPPKPAAIMLNGRLARAGEVVDPGLGVTFDSVEPEKKLIIFKDKAGATVTRRY
jgi:predicted component of type VI protein secretion system